MNITSLDILYLCLALGFVSLVVFINMILYNLWLMIKSMRNSVENVHSVTKGVVETKDKIKLTFLKGLKKVTSKLKF